MEKNRKAVFMTGLEQARTDIDKHRRAIQKRKKPLSSSKDLTPLTQFKPEDMKKLEFGQEETVKDLPVDAPPEREPLPFWDEEKGRLTADQKDKARILLKLDRVIHEDYGRYSVLPIEGYNKTTHKVWYDGKIWKCSCQWMRYHTVCAHILAVLEFKRRQTLKGDIDIQVTSEGAKDGK